MFKISENTRIILLILSFHVMAWGNQSLMVANETERSFLRDDIKCLTMEECENQLMAPFDPNGILTIAERIVLQIYTESYRISSEIIMESAVRKIPGVEALVYRGESKNHLGIMDQNDPNLPDSKKQVVTFDRLRSSSTIRDIAIGFTGGDGGILMVIKAKNAKNIVPYSVVGEGEHMLMAGTRLRVDFTEDVTEEVQTESGVEKRELKLVHMTEI